MGLVDAGATGDSESGGGGGGLDDIHHGSGDKMAQRNVGSDGGAEEGLNPSYGEAVVPVGEVRDWNTGVPDVDRGGCELVLGTPGAWLAAQI